MDIKLFNSISNKEFIEVLESVGFKTYNNDQVSQRL